MIPSSTLLGNFLLSPNVTFHNSAKFFVRSVEECRNRWGIFLISQENCYKLQTASVQRRERSRIFFLFPKVSEREIGEYNTYEPGIIHRIGTKCLFTSSFELSKLGTISDLRLGSREVPRVRSVIYVSPSPKRDPHRPPFRLPSTPFCRPSIHSSF